MEYKERIEIDIEKLAKNLKQIESIDFNEKELEVVERAKNYGEDTSYYTKKEDYMTAFGCITYAHGLIDSLRLIHNLI